MTEHECPKCYETMTSGEHHDCIRALLTRIANLRDELSAAQAHIAELEHKLAQRQDTSPGRAPDRGGVSTEGGVMSLEDAMRKWRGRGEMPSFDAIVEKAFSDGYTAGCIDEVKEWARSMAAAKDISASDTEAKLS